MSEHHVLRYDIINHLIKVNNYQRYLEIGVEGGDAFRMINAPVKHGVDPDSVNAVFKITSDDFFAMINNDVKYDIIFIDGLHVEEQVDRDIENSLKHLNHNGIIVVHDCNPPTEWHQRSFEEAQKNGCRQWNGTVWRSIVKLRASSSNLDIQVVNTDWGCGLIKPLDLGGLSMPMIDLPDNFTYEYLNNDRKNALNLISVDDFFQQFN